MLQADDAEEKVCMCGAWGVALCTVKDLHLSICFCNLTRVKPLYL